MMAPVPNARLARKIHHPEHREDTQNSKDLLREHGSLDLNRGSVGSSDKGPT